jgi:metacaspase-1
MNRALLVGINDYPGCPLRGCLNDVESMKAVLLANGFSLMNILTLTDHEAVMKSIVDSLALMVEQAHKGDHLVFHFSGHGSQVPDQFICGTDEVDGLDEIICPYDMDFNGIFIRDDTLRNTLQDLHPEATCDVFLDSCHSGTGLRGGDIPRFMPNPSLDFPLGYPVQIPVRGILKDDIPGNLALWAGCRDTQTSADAFIDGKPQGAFTWACTRALAIVGPRNRSAHIKSITNLLSGKGYEQTPQLECTEEMKGRRIFE